MHVQLEPRSLPTAPVIDAAPQTTPSPLTTRMRSTGPRANPRARGRDLRGEGADDGGQEGGAPTWWPCLMRARCSGPGHTWCSHPGPALRGRRLEQQHQGLQATCKRAASTPPHSHACCSCHQPHLEPAADPPHAWATQGGDGACCGCEVEACACAQLRKCIPSSARLTAPRGGCVRPGCSEFFFPSMSWCACTALWPS